MIVVFGSINVDLVAGVAAIPRAGETVLATGYRRWFGGKGANQAVAAARGGVRVAMAGAVGDDAFGRDCLANLVAEGVDVGAVATVAGAATGCAFIAVDGGGENAITVVPGANGAARAGQVTDEVLLGAGMVVLQMEAPVAESLAVARRARAMGVPVLLNLAPPLVEGFALLEACSVLVVNEHEAVVAARGAGDGTVEGAGAAAAAAWGVTVVETLGAAGAVGFVPGRAAVRVASPAVRAVDTTGAGDTFVGLLAGGLVGGMGLEAAMGRACRGAALACLAAGAQPGMPRAAALDQA